ncbi:MAG TPA: hypothetical protein VGJ26_21875 [Pirellulales bacterium]
MYEASPSVTLPQPGHLTRSALESAAGSGLGPGALGAEPGRGAAGRCEGAGTSTGARQLRQAKRRPAYCSSTWKVEPQASQWTGIDMRLPEAKLPDFYVKYKQESGRKP